MRSILAIAFTIGGSPGTFAKTGFQYTANVANIKNGTPAIAKRFNK